MTSLTIVRGLPGSGKSTLAKRLIGENSAHVEADMYFIDMNGQYRFDADLIMDAHDWCQRETHKHLHAGREVIVSNTFTTIRELRPYFDIAFDFDIRPTVISTNGIFGSIHGVPNETMQKMRGRFVDNISELYKERNWSYR
jgi:predicted kinase